jgi:hypothetical protein
VTDDDLNRRATEALKIIDDTISVIPSFEIKASANSLVALPLLYASMDNAAVCSLLLRNNPERSFVSIMGLHRSQWEFLARGAFFAHAAKEHELMRFMKEGAVPKRQGRDISLMQIVEESFLEIGWDERLVKVLRDEKGPLNGFVHGGREVVNAYLRNGEIGFPELDLPLLLHILKRIVAMSQLSMAVAMSMSSLPQQRISDAVRPLYEQVHNFYGAPAP